MNKTEGKLEESHGLTCGQEVFSSECTIWYIFLCWCLACKFSQFWGIPDNTMGRACGKETLQNGWFEWILKHRGYKSTNGVIPYFPHSVSSPEVSQYLLFSSWKTVINSIPSLNVNVSLALTNFNIWHYLLSFSQLIEWEELPVGTKAFLCIWKYVSGYCLGIKKLCFS